MTAAPRRRGAPVPGRDRNPARARAGLRSRPGTGAPRRRGAAVIWPPDSELRALLNRWEIDRRVPVRRLMPTVRQASAFGQATCDQPHELFPLLDLWRRTW